MRVQLIAAATAGVLAMTACSPRLDVRTSVTPDPNLTGRLTFHLLSAPGYLGGVTAGANHTPAINQATSDALRRDIVAALTRRGYVEGQGDAGFLVVYYVTMPPNTDFTDWNDGYLWRPAWARGDIPGSANLTPAEYADGAVVIDMIDPSTGALLWQGHGLTDLPQGERRLTRDLKQTVTAILGQVPVPAVAVDHPIPAVAVDLPAPPTSAR
jgi:hypothetical protein